jgi:hypothetical protein
MGTGQARRQTHQPTPPVQVMPMRTNCPQLKGFSVTRCGEPHLLPLDTLPTSPRYWTRTGTSVTRMDISARQKLSTYLYIYKENFYRYIYSGFRGYGLKVKALCISYTT